MQDLNINDKIKKVIKLLIRILVTAGLLVLVFRKIDLQQFGESIKTARWEFLVSLWILTIILFWLRSVKFKYILKKQGCLVKTATLFGASAVTSLYSLIMPGMLSTGAKWYVLKKSTGKGTNIFSCMVYNQLSIMVIVMVFGLAALIITNPTSLLLADPKNQWILPIACAILLATIVAGSLLLLNRKIGGKIIGAFSFLLKLIPAKMRQKGQLTLDQIALFQTAGYKFHLAMTIATIFINLAGSVILFILSAKTAHITVPIPVLVWTAATIYILSRLPISIANLGVSEVTLAGLLAIYGVETSSAVLMSMVFFSATILMATIGAVYQIAWTSKTNEPKPISV